MTLGVVFEAWEDIEILADRIDCGTEELCRKRPVCEVYERGTVNSWARERCDSNRMPTPERVS